MDESGKRPFRRLGVCRTWGRQTPDAKPSIQEWKKKGSEKLISSTIAFPIAARKGHYAGIDSKFAGGFAVSSLSNAKSDRLLGNATLPERNSVRLFFALWPDDATRAALARLSRSLHEQCGGRRVPEANIHLTLVFLGNVQAALVPAIRRMAESVQGTPVDLALDAVGYWRHNQIVWIGAHDCPEVLRELVMHLVEGVRKLGISTEARDYVPHITLLRRAQRGPVASSFSAVEWRAAEFVLIQSVPRQGGVVYEAIGRWPLAADAQ